MKVLLIALSCLWTFTTPVWETDFEKARQTAVNNHHLILLNFSGSDWCGPCIRLKNEFFNNTAFLTFADQQLVLLNADFPRSKKNQLSKEQQKRNDSLADKYNPEGHFPYTLLLDENGKVLKTWEGIPNTTPEGFVDQLKNTFHATGK
ncbi:MULTISPECIES: thioredoxin family protein [unclassified Chitinophaga]|uniref:thioredoxin family protein n=1 Tax=unclassified Chitinophaga TaxID=2619133 RepID=UPI0009C8799D|nr:MULTISPECIES: thioredoxin family protein [unclassified Chitinophaga]OMP75580.1 thiol-disulfide isomerase [[Flexibacter] sp. ATCC 35208]WPV64570.1 thioredoxin family protein [Chitinophaga sp. LS1]